MRPDGSLFHKECIASWLKINLIVVSYFLRLRWSIDNWASRKSGDQVYFCTTILIQNIKNWPLQKCGGQFFVAEWVGISYNKVEGTSRSDTWAVGLWGADLGRKLQLFDLLIRYSKWPDFGPIAQSTITSLLSITSSPVITILNWVDSSMRMHGFPQDKVRPEIIRFPIVAIIHPIMSIVRDC